MEVFRSWLTKSSKESKQPKFKESSTKKQQAAGKELSSMKVSSSKTFRELNESELNYLKRTLNLPNIDEYRFEESKLTQTQHSDKTTSTEIVIKLNSEGQKYKKIEITELKSATDQRISYTETLTDNDDNSITSIESFDENGKLTNKKLEYYDDSYEEGTFSDIKNIDGTTSNILTIGIIQTNFPEGPIIEKRELTINEDNIISGTITRQIGKVSEKETGTFILDVETGDLLLQPES